MKLKTVLALLASAQSVSILKSSQVKDCVYEKNDADQCVMAYGNSANCIQLNPIP